ncbi:MAG: methionyl-tRNA formyltransferase [Opitutales bacterium]
MPGELPKVAFFGSDVIALPLLRWLRREGSGVAQLVGVVSQPDRRSGRGKKLQLNPVAAFARDEGLPLLQPDKPDAVTTAWVQEQGICLCLVMAYGHILRRALLDAPPRGFLNLHGSLLPKLRGASPVETAIATGETVTGVSLMRMVRRMDAGAVADFETVAITEHVSGGQLREELATACVPLLARALGPACTGELAFAEQDESSATYCRKLSKEDGQLDFGAPAAVLARRIRGLDPWPGCFAEHHGTRLKLSGGAAEPDHSHAMPGTVLSADLDGVRVATGEGVLLLPRLQRPGGKLLPAPDFLRGYPLSPGDVLEGGPMTELLVKG